MATVALAGVLIVLLGLTLLPGAGARPPQPVMKLATAIVSPPPSIPLRFSHVVHSGPKFSCRGCHKKAARSSSASDLLLPTHKDCISCHKQAKIPPGFGRVGQTNNKACAYCHTRFLPNGFPVRVKWKPPRFRFPHRLHLRTGVSCQSCHKGIARKARVGRLHLPKMSACFKCHRRGPRAAKGRRASARCVTCHERIPGGRMRTQFAEGKLKPGASLPTLHHTATFKKHHKRAARSHPATCKECHEESTCLSCHGSTMKRATVHVGNVILLHGRQARANRKSCSSCHTRESFCLRCHGRLGLDSTSNRSPFKLPGVRKFHGPRWASSTSSSRADNRHAVHARRNATVCAACHRESSCLSCHSSRRLGGLGRNPHGPGFARSRRCRILARRSRRSCMKCHGAADPIMRCR